VIANEVTMSQTPRRVRGWFAVTVAAGTAAAALLPPARLWADDPAPRPATAPASRPAADESRPTTPASRPTAPASQPADTAKQIADAIDALGSGDFAERERAATALWSFGDAARPALEQAAGGDDPEAARRARGVLASFAFGVRPDTPKLVLDLLTQYRAGGPEQQKSAAGQLAARGGAHGARVLLKLATDEADPDVRNVVLNALGQVARPAAARLIGERDAATAGRILALLAPHAEHAARDHAALLLLHGGLDDALAALEDPADPNDDPARRALQKAWLYRAKGDLPAAAAAATAAGNQPLADALLADAGRYAELARAADDRAAAGGPAGKSVEEMGFATAYHRLAGDAAGADRWAARLVAYAAANPDRPLQRGRGAAAERAARRGAGRARVPPELRGRRRLPDRPARLRPVRRGGGQGEGRRGRRPAEADVQAGGDAALRRRAGRGGRDAQGRRPGRARAGRLRGRWPSWSSRPRRPAWTGRRPTPGPSGRWSPPARRSTRRGSSTAAGSPTVPGPLCGGGRSATTGPATPRPTR
jgi:hypothetical protein